MAQGRLMNGPLSELGNGDPRKMTEAIHVIVFRLSNYVPALL